MTEYHSLQDLQDLSASTEKEIWEIVQLADMEESGRTAEQSYQKMLEMYQAMICRGFSGQYPHRHQQPFGLADICPAIICILLMVLHIYLEY